MRNGAAATDPAAADILLIYHRPIGRTDAATVRDHISAFGQYSQFGVFGVNTEAGFPSQLRRERFPVILLHYSLFGGEKYAMPPGCLDYLAASGSSCKIAFFQDEYFACRHRAQFVEEYGIDCIYSLLEPQHASAVYGGLANAPRVFYTLPGYVSEGLVAAAERKRIPDEKRTIDVGYRGRELPPFMGREAHEKTAIAEEFVRRATHLGLRLDIETTEGSRLYGRRWYDFLAHCRACLGVEAGVSVFDLEGVVYEEYERLRPLHPNASFDEMVEKLAPVMDAWENRVYYRTISPRHFESAAFRVCQVLYEGRYSGILEPNVHFIPLKKDFSNFDEVIRAIKDPQVRRRVTEAAYEDLIASGDHSCERFIGTFDERLLEAGLRPRGRKPMARVSKACVRSQMLLPGGRAFARSAIRRVALTPFPGRAFLAFFLRPLVRALLRHSRRRSSLPRTEV